MDAVEYMMTINEFVLDMYEIMSDEELDDVEYTIGAVIRQMGWENIIQVYR